MPCIISKMASSRRPQLGRPKIGVFDSGVGGLTVLRALVERIPDADYLYFGDTARLPYGSKSAATVAHYAVGAVRYLQEQGAEAAAAASRKQKVVVIGTEATISSHAYRRALEARKVAVREKACPLFVPLVEEGWVEHPVTEQVAKIYLSEAFSEDASDADVLVLGCTHYPLIKSLLRRVAPEHISIVDSAESTAQDVARQLQVGTPLSTTNERRSPPQLKFFATDSAEKFRKMGTRFLGLPVEDVLHVDLKE